MPKISASVAVRGVDASEMLAEARRQLNQLAAVNWKLADARFDMTGPTNEVATSDGMLPMWSGWVTGEADVDEAKP